MQTANTFGFHHRSGNLIYASNGPLVIMLRHIDGKVTYEFEGSNVNDGWHQIHAVIERAQAWLKKVPSPQHFLRDSSA